MANESKGVNTRLQAKYCPACGKPNDLQSRYCIRCGALQPNKDKYEPKAKKEEAFITCPRCNYRCQKDWTACPMCNASLSTSPTPETPAEKPEEASPVTNADDEPEVHPRTKLEQALRESVKNDLDIISKAMGIISMHTLAQQNGSNEATMLAIVEDLIDAGEVDGHVDPYTLEFVSEIKDEPDKPVAREPHQGKIAATPPAKEIPREADAATSSSITRASTPAVLVRKIPLQQAIAQKKTLAELAATRETSMDDAAVVERLPPSTMDEANDDVGELDKLPGDTPGTARESTAISRDEESAPLERATVAAIETSTGISPSRDDERDVLGKDGTEKEARVVSANGEFDALARQQDALHNQVASVQEASTEIKAIGADILAEMTDLRQFLNQHDQLDKKIDQVKQAIEQFDEKLRELNINDDLGKIDSFHRELESLHASIEGHDKQADDAMAKIDATLDQIVKNQEENGNDKQSDDAMAKIGAAIDQIVKNQEEMNDRLNALARTQQKWSRSVRASQRGHH